MKIRHIIIAVTAMLSVACNQEPATETIGGVSLHSELGGAAVGFERACETRQFNFPQDHGAHRSFRNEWWYITGNAEDTSGQKFGFHVTFFRIANKPPSPASDITSSDTTGSDTTASDKASSTTPIASSWASNEFYMAHFAVTTEDREIKKFERFARGAAGLAGAEINIAAEANDTVRVWLDDWQLSGRYNNSDQPDKLSWHLSMPASDTELNLTLTPQKPIVLQGDAGYSQKSADPCNASYYYSLTRLQATGSLDIDGTSHNIDGTAWLDREWSSSALGDNQSGWDWFALQLDDGRDIMLYQLRLRDGTRDTWSHAVEIDQHGNSQEIPIRNIELKTTRWWQSDAGNRYPVAGVIRRKDTGETIEFQPLIDNQELDFTVRYWEGSIALTIDSGKSIGRGYMELTGY